MGNGFVAFVDDSMDDAETAWSGAVVIPLQRVDVLEREIDSLWSAFAGRPRRGTEDEMKGVDLIAGRGAFLGAGDRGLECVGSMLASAESAGAVFVFRGVRSSELVRFPRASGRARTPYDLAFGHLLHALHRVTRGRPVDVVHDRKPGAEAALRETFARASSGGVLRHRREVCTGMEGLEFEDSRCRRLLQLSDVVVSLRRRRWRDAGPGSQGAWSGRSPARTEVESAIRTMTAHTYCWRPRYDAVRRGARAAA